MMMGLLLVLSWARVRRVSLGREFRWGNLRGNCWTSYGCVVVVCLSVHVHFNMGLSPRDS